MPIWVDPYQSQVVCLWTLRLKADGLKNDRQTAMSGKLMQLAAIVTNRLAAWPCCGHHPPKFDSAVCMTLFWA